MNINVQDKDTQEPRCKAVPVIANTKYAPSPDKTDSNIVIVLHGLGDSEVPFHRMAQAWKLPQTAILSIRAPLQIPLLEDEQAFQWWPSFSPMGETLECRDPISAAKPLVSAINKLHTTYAWPYDAIHLFGYGQGGQIATSTAVALGTGVVLGSITTCCAPFLGPKKREMEAKKQMTELLLWRREDDKQTRADVYRNVFEHVTDSVAAAGSGGMPANAAEWKPIFEFYSRRLRHRNAFEFSDHVYRVV